MWLNPQFPVDLVTVTEEILNGESSFFVQCKSSKVYSLFLFSDNTAAQIGKMSEEEEACIVLFLSFILLS